MRCWFHLARRPSCAGLFYLGSLGEFVGESVEVNPSVSPRRGSLLGAAENQNKNLSKKEKQEAILRAPAGRGRAGRVGRTLNRTCPNGYRCGKTISGSRAQLC